MDGQNHEEGTRDEDDGVGRTEDPVEKHRGRVEIGVMAPSVGRIQQKETAEKENLGAHEEPHAEATAVIAKLATFGRVMMVAAANLATFGRVMMVAAATIIGFSEAEEGDEGALIYRPPRREIRKDLW
jgi:hypothetical protein